VSVVQGSLRNTQWRAEAADEDGGLEMIPRLNRPAVPTSREDSSRHASQQTEAPAPPAL